MKVLLIYPEIPDTFWSFKHALKFVHKKASSPPLGLVTVAALLPAQWEKRLVDCNVRALTEKDLAWADLAFISAMVVQKESVRKVVARCKAAGLKTVGGGPLFTCSPGEFGQVDHLVLDEAELTLPPFLEDLQKGAPRRIYSEKAFADLRETPIPLWGLADLKRYASMSVQYSRGCPYNCEFCNVTALFGHKPRTKTAAQIIAELESLHGHGWRGGIFFVDDNFIGNKARLKTELLPALIAWRKDRPGIAFNTEVSIDIADDPELMQMMVDAGFEEVFIGIETPSEESLTECKKRQNKNRDLVADVKRIQRAGLQVQGGFIVGFDSDTPSIFQRQIEFIQNSGIVTAMVGLLQAPEGTRLYERMKKEGRLTGPMTGDNVDGTTNIVPAMNLEALREGYKSILEHIYAPEHYYQRVRTFLREYKPSGIGSPLRFRDFMPFIRSVYHLGIAGRERIYYWRLLAWTRVRRPGSLSVAVTLAIYGHHFRKICELHVL